MEINEKGQAAVTDALYFLMIVTFLSIFLFGFSNTYGNSVEEQIMDQFNTTFATNALKTILYSSTPRDPSQNIYEDPDAEIDYLLAILKEDYADNEIIDLAEREVLGSTISAILSPISDTVDYVFYIRIPEQKKFVYFFFHTTNFEKDEANIPGGRFFVYSANLNDSHLEYFCGIPKNPNNNSGYVSYDDLLKRVNTLLANVGPTSHATSSIKLVKETSSGVWDSFDAQVDLLLWDATWLGRTDQRDRGLLYEDFPGQIQSEWGCELAS